MTLGGWGQRFMEAASSESDDSALDLERNHYHCNNHLSLPSSSSPSPLQPFSLSIQHAESNAPYFSWPTLSRLNDAVEDRANYFGNLQKEVLPEIVGRLPSGQQATTLLELMTIRAFHSKILRRFSLGTAVGFRISRGVLTNIPAILVFVARKVHRQWLSPMQCLPSALEGPGGVWCDVDVVEFQYYGAPAATPKEQVYNELVDGLRGSDPCIGSGSQVASQETYGTLGAIVKSRTGNNQVGFLTNRHVAVDLDYPSQKMFHPLPPSLGPGVYLGAVERATSFITDDQWYGIFAGTNPETFVRADGAFVPFAEDFNTSNVTTVIKGIGEMGNVHVIDLQSPIDSLIGKQVVKVGRSSGYTTGTIMAYALEYNDEKGICFLTDFLVIGENQQTFDLEGDSGSLILLTSPVGQKPRPVGIIWGGTANRGRLKLIGGQEPENWTSGVDLGRLLDLLELDLITSNHELEAAREQRNTSVTAFDSTVSQSSPPAPDPVPSGDRQDESSDPPEFHIEEAIKPTLAVEGHLFIAPLSVNESSSALKGQVKPEFSDLVALNNSSKEEVNVSLHLGEPKLKKTKVFF
uniref:Protein NARROW LEAF 1 n=1 Tax=Noccaea caerulescens TaxID=107243 RepID=A0A1J3D185_NOCCA